MSNQREVGDVKPSSLNHLIGQQGVIDQVRVAIDAAHMDGKKFDHALLVGPPGLGKSALANVISQEMAADFHEILGQSIGGPADLNALLLSAKDGDVIHIDECHELGKEYQTALYLALDKRKLTISGKGRSSQSLPLADFTLLLSTTDEYGLLQPLRDRMKLLLRLQFYTVEDLTSVLIQRCRALVWDVHEEIFPKISRRSRGTPRLALRLLQSCHRVCRSEGEDTITARHLQRACQLEGIDEIGLGPTERQYVELLSDGATRLNVLASALGLPSRTVSEVVEPFLIRTNLVMKDDQGRRQLTQQGHDHLSNSRNDAV
ncbi:AAA family ATPase [Gimesia chilikensis]|uniref:Holliday junction DNA helicase RuvB C-terminal domain-containing protein n=1 Tax=Gimesia chilikensis TaxID=2605989 RepID=UPI0011EF5761|nr:Holliday junction DNA helicase RuvB C-terminal domain-containing protein [Gimesia chilikensis]KAA0131589.1 AAA family ATPase [Gimesia chilikensis]